MTVLCGAPARIRSRYGGEEEAVDIEVHRDGRADMVAILRSAGLTDSFWSFR